MQSWCLNFDHHALPQYQHTFPCVFPLRGGYHQAKHLEASRGSGLSSRPEQRLQDLPDGVHASAPGSSLAAEPARDPARLHFELSPRFDMPTSASATTLFADGPIS